LGKTPLLQAGLINARRIFLMTVAARVNAMTQAHAFEAAELCLKAQAAARRIA
jgi:hypothetical protein